MLFPGTTTLLCDRCSDEIDPDEDHPPVPAGDRGHLHLECAVAAVDAGDLDPALLA